MPALILFKSPAGSPPGETIPLDRAPSLVIGRDADLCQVVIPDQAVSRKHARITWHDGQYHLEDLRSRNKTYVNNDLVTGRVTLRPEDRIKICDFVFRFYDERAVPPKPLPPEMRAAAPDDDEADGMTTIEATQRVVSVPTFLDAQPSDRLRALLEISTSLSRTLELDPLLGQIADTLFGVFRQADRCFLILLDETGRQVPKVTKGRRPGADESRHSRTIVRKAVESLQSYLSEDASNDAALGPAASIADFKIRSVMCVPLVTSDGTALGAIQLDTQDRQKKFREDDLKLLSIVANLASVAIEKARLHETLLAREKERREVALARAVQLGFLPQTVPEVEGYEFYSHYSPAQTVGGDYYDFIQLPGGRLAVVLGDVAGKGVPAALLVAKLSSEVRFCLLTEPDVARAVGRLNDQMLRGGMADRFVTLAVVVLDPAAHRATVVNAGHMSPKLYRADAGHLGEAITTDEAGCAIGVMPGEAYKAVTVGLGCGDVLTLYTDGVTDAMAPDGAMFGTGGLNRCLAPDENALADPVSLRPRGVGERLMRTVTRHASGREQNDDIAVVCFGRLEPGPGPITGRVARARAERATT